MLCFFKATFRLCIFNLLLSMQLFIVSKSAPACLSSAAAALCVECGDSEQPVRALPRAHTHHPHPPSGFNIREHDPGTARHRGWYLKDCSVKL